jgi:DNA-binding CsgD family transcriptional regulator
LTGRAIGGRQMRSKKSSSRQPLRVNGDRTVFWTEHDVGLAVLSFDVGAEGFASISSPERVRFAHVGLSPTQRIVAELVACGRTNAEVSQEMGIAVRTVANHMAAILRKTGASSRFELARRRTIATTV